jgi:DNA-binding transcriptional LysR family regulator
MISRCAVFCKVIEHHSFTKAAEELGYSQSSVSQTVMALEGELGATLIERRRDGVVLTPDGEQLYPYIRAVSLSEKLLEQKKRELSGLENSTISIGTFTSVSRNILPPLMKSFKEIYPTASFILRQGDYASIGRWIRDGSVDFGFTNTDAVSDLDGKILYEDEMMAVLPQEHPLAQKEWVSLHDLVKEPFILLDEGGYSVPMTAFQKLGLSPQIAYEVYDDYTILAMVRQGLGVSLMYQAVLTGLHHNLALRPVTERPKRTVALVWKDRNIISQAAKRFSSFIIDKWMLSKA